jgi:hypothetical protein
MTDTAANFFALLLLGFFPGEQCTAMATTGIGIRMVTAQTTTVMPVTERHWRRSTVVGSAAALCSRSSA